MSLALVMLNIWLLLAEAEAVMGITAEAAEAADCFIVPPTRWLPVKNP